jgi:alkylated DNA repair dioxygenase AlkB
VGAGIGWHTDADRFDDTILAVSLAGHAKLRFRPNGATEHTHELIVAPGALYVLQGPVRWEYQHQVVPVKNDRYSLTFRTVRTEPKR